jgi:serine protease inhibitor
MKNVMRFLLVFTVVFAVACGGGKTNDPVIRDLTQTEQKLVESSNLFGFNLMKEVVAQSDGGNVFISPLSVSFALGMTYNGARGTTEGACAPPWSMGISPSRRSTRATAT